MKLTQLLVFILNDNVQLLLQKYSSSDKLTTFLSTIGSIVVVEEVVEEVVVVVVIFSNLRNRY